MFDKYKVLDGDTVESIAKKFNTEKRVIMDYNNMYYEDQLRNGEEIIVPKTDSYYDIYTVSSGDTLYNISKEYNINPILLAALNGLNDDDYIYPNQEILIPKAGFSYYITKEGDTLDMVSEKFGCERADIINTNVIYLMPSQLIVNKK